ncbi:MAG: hypothetical protein Q8S03_00435 [Brevundimonas sp.]|uniref:hypothetical protein n=1 Tax=Brevundimonas sp. TaxID=1871086 RepID=UPI0027342EF3|nr:hypothetical protein [Brevundimonas sp.]MDP3403119.1 hypothetical protein [Brevundimonas sp.]
MCGQCDLEIDPGAVPRLILIHDGPLHAGPGFDPGRFLTHPYGIRRGRPGHRSGTRMQVRRTSAVQNVHFDRSGAGVTGKRVDRGLDVSGDNRNVRSGFMMLRPAMEAAGEGEAGFRNARARAP